LKQAFYISVEGGMNIGVNLFGPRKPHNEEVEMAIREWLPLQRPDLYRDGFFSIRLLGMNALMFQESCVEKDTTLEHHLRLIV
jgi:hypothetical protein